MIRTIAPTKEDVAYDWTLNTVGQCTWYCYHRAMEEGLTPPTWQNKAKQSGKYPNAKNWVANNRNPWIVKDTDYIPQHNDIAVFDGQFGHVIYIERNDGDTCLISQYNLDAPQTFSNATWTIGKRLYGKKYNTGNLLGYLHYPQAEDTDYKQKYEIAQSKLDRIEAIINE